MIFLVDAASIMTKQTEYLSKICLVVTLVIIVNHLHTYAHIHTSPFQSIDLDH